MAKYRITPSSKAIIQLPISIGHKAEKGVEAIEFDLTAWVETYGSGTLTVIMRRWGDAIPYPIALEIDENNKATWTLSDIDTAKAGMAYAQLSYIVGDEVVKKSDIYTFRVMDSLTGEGDPPEAYESWLEHLTHFAAEAMAEVLDIEGIVTDKTLTVDGGIADAKATGDALALKADKSTTYTKTEVDQMIEDVEVETDTTLSVSGAPADAKKTGDEISAIKADLAEEIRKTVTPSRYDIGYIGSNGSAVTTDTNYYFCDYIKLPFAAGVNIKFKVSMLTSRGMAFYDSNKTFILAVNGNNCGDYGYSASATPQEINVTVPNGTVYVRITQRSTYVSSVNDFGVTGVNFGTIPEYVSQIPNMTTTLNAAVNNANDNTDSRRLSATWTAGGFITAGGIVSSNAGLSYTNFIYIGGLINVRLPMYIAGTGASIVLFDSKKKVTRYFQNPTDPVGTELNITLTDDDVYIRISCYTSRLNNFYLISDKISESIAKTFRILNGQHDVPFSKIIHDGGMTRIFNTIGVIGDSLSSGEMAYGNASGEDTTEYTDMYQYSWIQYLARECGIKAFNFSQGGMNTENFLSGTGGQLAKFQNPDNKCQAYFIALGHNDYNYGVPIGSPSDINVSDPTQDPGTYYGNYAHIIALIKQVQPNAKIFCICMKSTHFAEYNEAIRYMPTVFDNVYVLDFETYYPLLESGWEYTQGHGNAMGYLNYSWQIGTFVDWIIRNNRTDFKYVQFIGTDYDQYIPIS